MSAHQLIYRTAESVSPGHPDKLCDQISDAILDAYLERDPRARVAVETAGGHGKIFITGEVSASGFRSGSLDVAIGNGRKIAGNGPWWLLWRVSASWSLDGVSCAQNGSIFGLNF